MEFPYKIRFMKTFYFYIMFSSRRVLYTGVTSDLGRRVYEHKQKSTPGFTSRYDVTNLAYYELYQDVNQAIYREKQIKGWLRKKKVALIESLNPKWIDLTSTITD